MTFTKTPPQQPGFYACRTDEHDESRFSVYLYIGKDGLVSEHSGETPQEMNCEWCRLVPASELTDAWCEGRSSVFASTLEETKWQNSRAKRVAEGEE